jgi:outer membrane murein-binding lipoprotein Lpp
MKTKARRCGLIGLVALAAVVVAGCAPLPAPDQQQEVEALRQQVQTLEAQVGEQDQPAAQPTAVASTEQVMDQMSQVLAAMQGMAAMVPEAERTDDVINQAEQMQRDLDAMRQGGADPQTLQNMMGQTAGMLQQMQNMVADGRTVTDMNQFVQQMGQMTAMLQNMATQMPGAAGTSPVMGQMNQLQQDMNELLQQGSVSPQTAQNVMGQAANLIQQMGQMFGDLPAGASQRGGGMMDGQSGGMMGGRGQGPQTAVTPQPGTGPMGPQGAMMGPGGGPSTSSGQGMMMGGFWRQPGAVSSPTPEQAEQLAEQYTASFGENLEVAEIMAFSNHYYVQARETDTGRDAFEFLIDGVTGAAYPEPGPNMMWNTKYGHMGSMFGQPSAEMTVSEDEAVQLAQNYLDRYQADLEADEHADSFYGYYTLHTLRDGAIVGMLSVNATTGQVWYHSWHGQFEGIVHGEEH